jgi:type I restriction enzyme M protein
VAAFNADDRTERKESERFHCFSYDELLQRDKASLDLIWLRDDSLEDGENLPDPAVIAAEIVEDLEAALAQFSEIAASLGSPTQEDG